MPRRVQVMGWVVQEAESPPPGEQMMVVRLDHIRALLADASRGAVARVVVEGVDAPWRGVLGAVTAVAPRGGATRTLGLTAHLSGAPNVEGGALTGRVAAVWFGHPSGVVAFRARVTSATRDRLFLDVPQTLLRYTRRRAPRHAMPPGTGPLATFPLEGGAWVRDAPVLDLSTSGLAVLLPKDVELPDGGIVRLSLQLPDGEWLAPMVRSRHARPHDAAFVRHGLEILDPPRAMVQAIERCILSHTRWAAAEPERAARR